MMDEFEDTEEQAETIVVLALDDRQGYTAEQVERTMTLWDLQRQLTEAIEKFGPDAKVVTFDESNRYGAGFGGIDPYADTFTAAQHEEEN
jgi:anti-sigma regulatory factor (Ser/Thr protein kinase)